MPFYRNDINIAKQTTETLNGFGYSIRFFLIMYVRNYFGFNTCFVSNIRLLNVPKEGKSSRAFRTNAIFNVLFSFLKVFRKGKHVLLHLQHPSFDSFTLCYYVTIHENSTKLNFQLTQATRTFSWIDLGIVR